jgi:basic membrane protein A
MNRRSFLVSATATVASLGIPPWVTRAAEKKVVMGFIYVGPKDDYGYNQAHAEGCLALQRLPWVKSVEEANVPETTAVQETMRNMVMLDGAQMLFPTSFGYFNPHILKVAKQLPKVQFFHCGGLYQAGKHPRNVGSYFGYIDEAVFISGIVAGHATKSGKLGFIAAKPIPQVLRNINAFTLGARQSKPDAMVQTIFTGDWSMPVKEAEAATSLINQGVDVLTCHVDSPKVILETAERRGIDVCGYHTNGSKLAPAGYLTGAEWNWSKVYADYAEMVKAGKSLSGGSIPHLIRGGLKESFVKCSEYGPHVGSKAKADAEAAKAKFMDGSMVIFKGPLKDNGGKEILAAGKEYKQQDLELESMSWLVEGVIGSTKS